jgi:hypothetical protein
MAHISPGEQRLPKIEFGRHNGRTMQSLLHTPDMMYLANEYALCRQNRLWYVW